MFDFALEPCAKTYQAVTFGDAGALGGPHGDGHGKAVEAGVDVVELEEDRLVSGPLDLIFNDAEVSDLNVGLDLSGSVHCFAVLMLQR